MLRETHSTKKRVQFPKKIQDLSIIIIFVSYNVWRHVTQNNTVVFLVYFWVGESFRISKLTLFSIYLLLFGLVIKWITNLRLVNIVLLATSGWGNCALKKLCSFALYCMGPLLVLCRFRFLVLLSLRFFAVVPMWKFYFCTGGIPQPPVQGY